MIKEFGCLKKRTITPAYVFFYILFWPDTWRMAIGLAAAVLVAPLLLSAEQGWGSVLLIHLMIACIGYAVSSAPARGFAGFLQQRVLNKKIK
jgi:hypothetical protein